MDATKHNSTATALFNTVAILFDFENVTRAFRHRLLKPEKFSEEAGFEELIDRITKQVGKIVMFCLFIPDYFLEKGYVSKKNLEFFQSKGFFTIVCPKIGPKRKDTSDLNMIKFGLDVMLPYFSGITHICIGSGDVDFLELCEKVKRSGHKLMVTMGSNISLSGDVRKMVDINPKTGEKMIYLFSPIRR